MFCLVCLAVSSRRLQRGRFAMLTEIERSVGWCLAGIGRSLAVVGGKSE